MFNLELWIDSLVEIVNIISDYIAAIINELKKGNWRIIPATVMDFIKSVIFAFISWYNFSGRASRSEYWYFWIFSCFMMPGILQFMVRHAKPYLYQLLSHDNPHRAVFAALFIAFLIISVMFYIITTLSLAVRRVHDTNRGGLAVLYALVPFSITWFALLITKGSKGPNDYGPDPLAYEYI